MYLSRFSFLIRDAIFYNSIIRYLLTFNNDVVNDYHRTHFNVANSKSFKSMIVISEIVVDEINFLIFSTNRRRFCKMRV